MPQSVRDEILAKLKAAPKVPIPPRPPKPKLHEHSLTGEGVIEKFIKTLMEETGIVHRVTNREEVLRKLSENAYEERLKKAFLERLALGHRINHLGNPILIWMMANVMIGRDPAENIKCDKAKSTGRIDGIVALIMALGRAMANTLPVSDGQIAEVMGG